MRVLRHQQKVSGALHRQVGNINLLHTNPVIAGTKIKFGKKLSTSQFVQKVINERNGKFIFDGNFVERQK
jgi:hypothetical protein